MQKLSDGPIAQLPNNCHVQASHKAILNLHEKISPQASEVLIFPHLKNESLISIGQLCDDNCIVIFTKDNFFVTKMGKCLFQGSRNKEDGLWDWNQHIKNKGNKINYIISKNKNKLDLARYYHATLFSPSLSTLTKAIRTGNLESWPGIKHLNFTSLICTSLATECGHLDQERKNLQSTKSNHPNPTPDSLPTENEFYIHCFQETYNEGTIQKYRKIYSDQTGRFPYKSSRGSQHLLVMYDYLSNAIVFEALRSRQSKEMATAFKKCCKKLKILPSTNNMFILDNECSTDIKNAIKNYNANFQLVPPHQHRRKSNKNGKKSLTQWIGHLPQKLPNNGMGSNPTTSRNHAKFDA